MRITHDDRSKYTVASYDKGMTDGIQWLRPEDFALKPEYFKDVNRLGDMVEAR